MTMTDSQVTDVGSESAPSDQSLLQRCSGGSEDAATQLYLRYAQRLGGLVRAQQSAQMVSRLDVEDVVQSVFRSFFRTAHTGVYEVPRGGDLWRLLMTIALNKIRAQGEFHRAAKRDVRLTVNMGSDDPSENARNVREATDPFLRVAIDEALQGLLPQQRAIVELRLQGHEVAEIARQVGRSKRTVERSLQQGLARLKTLFEEA
jgi:RNA polymerase sigma-70 factor (ECF subfamily)